MTLSQMFRNLLLSFLAVVSSLASGTENGTSAAPSCRSQDEKDSQVAGRARFVVFPDGRRITIVSHQEGEAQIAQIVSMFRSGEFLELTDEEFDRLILEILQKNSKEVNKVSTLQHAEQDYAYLKSLVIKGQEKIEFISHDGLHETLDKASSNYRVARNRLISEYKKRSSSSALQTKPQNIMDVLLTAMTAKNYLYAEDPTLDVKVPLLIVRPNSLGLSEEEYWLQLSKQLAAQGKSGVHFVEMDKLQNSVSALEQVCTAELNQRLAESSENREKFERRHYTESGRVAR